MTSYEKMAAEELFKWQKKMQKPPSIFGHISKNIQNRVNNLIPDKIHRYITATIKQMVHIVLFGSKYTTKKPKQNVSLQLREAYIWKKIDFYKKTAATEGAITGAGGILLGLVDFPLLLSLKIKLLFDIAALYGYDVKNYKERLFILYIFQLAFSSQKRRNEVYQFISDWETYSQTLPGDLSSFNWRTFQQEYRDYIDLAKLAQLIPIIGAPVGAIVNYQLMDKLGNTAKNAYRMRNPELRQANFNLSIFSSKLED